MLKKNIKPTIYIPALIILILAIIAIIGYATKDTGSPVRVLMKTKAGIVKFTHTAHISDYEIECDTCHHEGSEEDMKCRNCHGTGTDDNISCDDRIHKDCIGGNCYDCHEGDDNLGTEGECNFCHRIW